VCPRARSWFRYLALCIWQENCFRKLFCAFTFAFVKSWDVLGKRPVTWWDNENVLKTTKKCASLWRWTRGEGRKKGQSFLMPSSLLSLMRQPTFCSNIIESKRATQNFIFPFSSVLCCHHQRYNYFIVYSKISDAPFSSWLTIRQKMADEMRKGLLHKLMMKNYHWPIFNIFIFISIYSFQRRIFKIQITKIFSFCCCSWCFNSLIWMENLFLYIVHEHTMRVNYISCVWEKLPFNLRLCIWDINFQWKRRERGEEDLCRVVFCLSSLFCCVLMVLLGVWSLEMKVKKQSKNMGDERDCWDEYERK
jgi:hypothetical protein